MTARCAWQGLMTANQNTLAHERNYKLLRRHNCERCGMYVSANPMAELPVKESRVDEKQLDLTYDIRLTRFGG